MAELPEHAGVCNGIDTISEGAYRTVSVRRTTVWGKRNFLYPNEYCMSPEPAGRWIETPCRRNPWLWETGTCWLLMCMAFGRFPYFAKYLHSGRKRNGMIYQDWLTHFPQRFCMLRCFLQGIIVLMPFDHGRGPASGRADPSVIPVTDEIYSGESFKFIGVFFSVITLI